MVTFVNLNPVNTKATDICILLCLTNAAHFVNLFKTLALHLFFIYSFQYFWLSTSHFLVTVQKCIAEPYCRSTRKQQLLFIKRTLPYHCTVQ
jgi:hypothetical protein